MHSLTQSSPPFSYLEEAHNVLSGHLRKTLPLQSRPSGFVKALSHSVFASEIGFLLLKTLSPEGCSKTFIADVYKGVHFRGLAEVRQHEIGLNRCRFHLIAHQNLHPPLHKIPPPVGHNSPMQCCERPPGDLALSSLHPPIDRLLVSVALGA